MEYILANWQWILPCAFILADKIVKLTATKKDDFLLDIVWNGVLTIIRAPRGLMTNSKYFKAIEEMKNE